MVNSCAGLDWLATAREVLAIESEGLLAVRETLNGDFTRAVELLAGCTGRVVVTGLGKSGHIGRKIAATMASLGTPAFFLHPVEGAHGDLGMVAAGDVVLALSNSGETEELLSILPSLRQLGARVVALTAEADSTLGRHADVVVAVKVPREACHMGLAPTASSTAALAVGDALAVCLMRRKDFGERDFKRCHPGGALGRRLSQPLTGLMHTAGLPVAEADAPLGQALAVMSAGGLGFAAVVDPGGLLLGVLSDGDVRRLAVAGGLDMARPAAEVMTRNPKALGPANTAAEAMDIMEQKQITVLPVVDGGRLVGMVHLHDLLGKGRLRFAG